MSEQKLYKFKGVIVKCTYNAPDFKVYAMDVSKKDYPDIEIEELDLDFDEEEVKKYNVGDTLPVVIFMKDNQEVERLIGEKTKEEIYDFVERNR